jgi:hypothetical protein
MWVNGSHVTNMCASSNPGFVLVGLVNGKIYELSPFKPQERNDEAFMSTLSQRTTLNEAVLSLEDR